jgi:hypothetical protein
MSEKELFHEDWGLGKFLDRIVKRSCKYKLSKIFHVIEGGNPQWRLFGDSKFVRMTDEYVQYAIMLGHGSKQRLVIGPYEFAFIEDEPEYRTQIWKVVNEQH